MGFSMGPSSRGIQIRPPLRGGLLSYFAAVAALFASARRWFLRRAARFLTLSLPCGVHRAAQTPFAHDAKLDSHFDENARGDLVKETAANKACNLEQMTCSRAD
jgi:hypothetical protein